MRRHAFRCLVLAVAGLLPSLASATTIVPAADPGELAVSSHAVFLARAGASRLVERERYLSTATELEVVSVIKGRLEPGDVIESIVPGGVRPDGSGWLVAGTPKLEQGEVYLFFADRDPRGRWQPRLMADSVLREAIDADGTKVLVPLEEASHLNRVTPIGPSAPLVPGPIYEDLFIEQLDRSLAGEIGWSWAPMMAELDVDQDLEKAVPSGCAFMEYNSRNIRWNRWDLGGSTLSIYAEDDGDSSLSGGGFSEVSGAISRWNTAPDPTSIKLGYGGTQNLAMTCTSDPQDTPPSSANIVVFNDPCDDIANLSGCSGTLAFGGPWFGATHTFDGATWYTATSLFVVVNNGSGCLKSLAYELMITHELGHGLGFGHVSDSSALMYASCCHAHNSTDITCARYAYPVAPTPMPTTPTTPTNTPTSTATPTPTWTPGGPTATPTTAPPTQTPGGATATPTPTRTPTPTATVTPTPTSGVPVATKVTVPVVVHTEGVGGTSWRSDVTVTNRNAASQTLRLTYQTTAKASFTKNRSLAGFATMLLEDLVQDLFRAGDSRGPLDVEVLSGAPGLPVVVSRAYAEAATGNLGSGLPADIVPSTDVVTMPGLYHDDAFRTNIAVTAGDEATWATFELFRGGSGLVAGGVQRKIEAGEQNQWSIQKLFGSLAQQGVPMTVRVTLTKPGIVYASIVDNDSTDSAVYLGKRPANRWIVPVVAHLPGAGGTFWSSSVSLWNSTGSSSWIDLEYLPEKTDNSRGGLYADRFALKANGTLDLSDVLKDEFSIDNGKGVLLIVSTRPITVSSRVFTDCTTCPAGGTSGNGVRTVPEEEFASGTTVLPGVRVRDGFRTNVGVVSDERTVSFTFDLRDEGGTLRATAFKTLPPRTMQQWSVDKLFGSGFVKPNPAGSIVITANRPYLAYMTIIDGSSQDPVFVMPQ